MKIISHRGNIKGSLPDKENRPSYIDCAIALGYDVEIDVRFINNTYYLGHDEPQYKVNEKWLEERINRLWIHCKNIDAAIKISQLNKNYIFFGHSNDPYVIISNKKIWCHALTSAITNECVVPLMSEKDIEEYSFSIPYAACTDYPNYILSYWEDKCKL